ncbi:MAG: hypothetical protein ACREMB_26000 [Candidatus Rokuibacteriota bacterium]
MRRAQGRLVRALGVVLLAAGCATVPAPLPPVLGGVPAEQVSELLRRWEADWRQFPGLRAAVDVTVARRGRAQRSAGGLLLSPTHLRFEALAPLGFPALVVTAGPAQILVFSPTERRAWSARPTAEAMERWLGVPVVLDTLIRLLVGWVPAPPAGATVRVAEDRGPHILVEHDRLTQRIWVTAEGRPARLELEDGARVTVTFERGVDGNVQSLAVEAPGQGLELALRYISAEYGPPPQAAFDLRLPPGVPVDAVN